MRAPRRRLPAAAGILGVLHAASFAPWPLWWLQILSLALALRLMLTAGRESPGRAALVAFAFGLGHYVAGLCWLYISMNRYGGMPAPLAAAAVIAFSAYLALFTASAIALAHAARRTQDDQRLRAAMAWAASLASAWTLADLARGWLFTGFPWLSVGYAHVDGPLAGFAALIGVYGVGMAAVWTAALLALASMRCTRRVAQGCAGLAGATLLAALSLGALEFTEPAGPPVSVRLVQGNVPQQLKFDPQRTLAAMQSYAQRIAQSPAALTVLPETAWTAPWTSTPPAISADILAQVRGKAHAVAIGLPLIEPDASGHKITNSVILLADRPSGAGEAARYDKHHLVPFGEFVPWGFDWFVQLMRIPLGSFARGELVQTPFAVGGQRFAVNICYEDLFGEEIVGSVREPAGATVLVNVSNIAWFGDSHALPQHREIARMRTLETGRPMLRATNTGVTASIDHRARVLAQLPPHREGVLDVAVQGMRGLTPYVRTGNLPVLLIAIGLLIASWRQARPRAAIQ